MCIKVAFSTCLHTQGSLQSCCCCDRSEPSDDHNGNKRKRFTDEQLSALTDLAEEANWSLLSVAKEVREQFCLKYEISKVGCFVSCHFLVAHM